MKLLGPWTHDGELDDAVFQLAATFPLHQWQDAPYKIPGDEYWPFDPNVFAVRLVEETGVAHVWEPVATKVAEGGRTFVSHCLPTRGGVPDQDRQARHKTRELLWNIWSRFSRYAQLITRRDTQTSEVVRTLFEDFLIANADLVQQVVAKFQQKPFGVGQELLLEIEQRAMRRI